MKIAVFLILCLSVKCQLFCSAYCTNIFTGSGFTQGCTGPTSTACTACDTRFFTINTPSCNINTASYQLQAKDFDPAGVLDGSWSIINSSNVQVSTYNLSYTIVEFLQTAALSKTFVLLVPHSALLIRMFVMIIANPVYTMKMIIDGNLSYPIQVDDSPRLFLSNTSSDAYIYTSDEIPHSSGSVALTLWVSAYQIFTTGTFGIKELLILTKNCPVFCATCDSTGACTDCLLIGGTTQYLLSNGQCLVYCLPGWFMDSNAVIPDRCSICDPTCLTCQGTSTNCTSCSQINIQYQFWLNNSCVATCPPGYYYTQGTHVCLPCFIGCSSCFGGDKDSCYACTVDTQGNNYYLVAGSTSCELQCPEGQFIDQTLSNTCTLCDPTCSICSINSTNCLACTTSGISEAFLYPYNNTCMTPCPINYTQNNISHQCVCPNSNYVDNSTYSCLPCSYVCRNCFGPSVDNCTVCSYPYYLLANSTKCRSACPSGQYADDTDRHCGLCDRICFTCTGSSSYCTGCSNGTYLVGSMCLNDCPDGYQKLTTQNKCNLCPQLSYSYNGSCVAVCPAGYGPVGVVCISNQMLYRKKATFNTSIYIVNMGTRLQLQLKFSSPVSADSNLSFSNIQISIIGTQLLDSTQPSLQQLQIKNLLFDATNTTMTILTPIPSSIDNYQSVTLTISFNQQYLVSSDGLMYDIYSASVALGDPNVVRELFSNYYKSSLDGVGIFMTAVSLIVLVMGYWNKKCQFICLEFFAMIQIVRLFNFIKFPIDQTLAAFLRGFDASHFQFMPNLFPLLVGDYSQNSPATYQYKSIDMNFFRLSCSMLLTMIAVSVFVGYFYLYDKSYYRRLIKWLGRLIIYVSCINLLFASTSSLVGLCMNPTNTSAIFGTSQVVSLLVGGLVIGYLCRHKNRMRNEGLFIISAGISCIFYPLFSFSQPIILILNDISQILLIVYFCKNIFKYSKKNWCILSMRISLLLMLNIFIIVESSIVLISLLSSILLINLLTVLYIYYKTLQRSLRKEKIANNPQHIQSNNVDQQLAPNPLMTNNTLITELNETIKVGGFENTIIYQHEIEESPCRHPSAEPKKVHMDNGQQDPSNSIQIKAMTEMSELDLGGTMRGRTVYQPSRKRKFRFGKNTSQINHDDESEI